MNTVKFTQGDVDQLLKIASDTLDHEVLTVINEKFITNIAEDFDIDCHVYDETDQEEIEDKEKMRSYYNDFLELLKGISGFYLKLEVEGSHKTDSQLVDYTLYLYRPDNTLQVKFEEEMCLMFGFDYDGPDVIIEI